jgi:hypothetical protein
MDELAHYIRLHLAGSATGIELYGRGSGLHDPAARDVVASIRTELRGERRQLLAIARSHDIRPAPLLSLAGQVGERIGRLKPNGHPVKRTLLTDVIDLEAMRVAVAGKTAGWEAMLTVAGDEHRDQLRELLDQAHRQHDDVSRLHREAAARAFAG